MKGEKMKSLIRTIIVLAVLGFAIASYTLAQGGINAEASAEAGEQPVVAAPSSSKEPVPKAPPPSVGTMLPAAGESAVFEGVAVEPSVFPSTPRKTVSYFVKGKSDNMLVIPDTEIKAEDVAAITQDMQVMSHIFDKIFKGPRMIGDVFMDYGDFFGRGSRTTQAIYIQGYGTLFLLEVDFPFSPMTKPKEKAEETKEADSVWQQAKQEVFSPTRTVRGKVTDPENKYDEEKVKELKTRLIKALKHAANIRNIKSDEWIILTATGTSQQAGMTLLTDLDAAASVGWTLSNRRMTATDGKVIVTNHLSRPVSTVLTIRAKKSDVDAFAKGELDYDKFREKVQILTYPSWGQQVGQEVSHHFPSSLSAKQAVR